jgi:hypothetical protein
MTSPRTLYLKHLLLLSSGSVLGLIAAYCFNLIEFPFSGEIQKAKDLGIVSLTVLSGYPKSRDILTYASVLCFPVIFSLGIWYLWARNKREQLREIYAAEKEMTLTRDTRWVLCLLSVVILGPFISFNAEIFSSPGWNRFVGSWVLLGEEGENLAWVQSIFSGGVYGKDFFCLYGPMLIHPLAWVMNWFGDTVVVERGYKYLLDLSAHFIVIFYFYRTLRWKATFLLASLVYLFTFPSLTLSLNTTYLRFVLGILPLFLAYRYLESGQRRFLLFSGIAIGQSLLFSQEVGLCSVVSLFGAISLYALPRHGWQLLAKDCLLIIAGCLVSMAPMLIYLSLNGAIPPFLDSIYGYPKLHMLGYASLAFPSLRDFIADLMGGHLFFYWPVLFYAFASIYLITRVILGKIDRNDMLKIAVLLFGILLYRVALGRSSHENVYKVFAPVVVLLFLLLDGAVTAIVSRKDHVKAGALVMALALVLSTTVLYANADLLRNTVTFAWQDLVRLKDKFSYAGEGEEIPSLRRGGIHYESSTAHSIMNIADFLASNTKPGDYVYFFPNEPAYYFLFDRMNPTRYAMSYFAITTGQRRELIGDLEDKKPEYVVYSLKTWRPDNIMETVQVPEVVRYIHEKYRLYKNMGDVLILKRSAV